MFTFSFCLLKHFYRCSASKVMTRKHFHVKSTLPAKANVFAAKGMDEFTELSCEVKHSDMVKIFKLLKDYEEPEAVNWEKVLKNLSDSNLSSPTEAVVLTCLKLGKIDYGMSLFKYSVEKGDEFSASGILHFSRLLIRCTDDSSQHEEIVKSFYEKVKEYVFSSSFIKVQTLDAFLKFPSCFWDCVENLKGTKSAGNQGIIHRAFEIDEPEVAWNFIKDNDLDFSNKFLRTYLNFCTRQALEGKFSVSLINDLVGICAERLLVLNTNNVEFEMSELIETLKLNKNDYTLVLEKCNLSNDNVCSNCGLQLKSTPLSADEHEKVRNDFFNLAICNKNLSLHTSEKEVNDFKVFLENCNPYNMVLDGLNMLYRGRGIGIKFYNQYLKYFLDRNFKVLVIGRKHSKALLTKAPFLRQNSHKRNFQIFVTSDTADDDLFILYAALHGGPKTFFFSGDLLSLYSSYFSNETRILFNKWKLHHQYLMHSSWNMLPPWPHMGLPQLTAGPNEDGVYTWHISNSLCRDVLTRTHKINWACLKAVPRENKI